ncbi:MAG: hypothetical protein P0S95_03785 [Rhabdochlamydiaceae bacterium]|nr:hypothetical protein [Candidatus Amphrikana amoebophyrae]
MQKYTIALFGEAEKGAFQTLYYLKNLPQIHKFLGEAPTDSLGLSLAVQLIHYERELIFLRVEEEGFSLKDYYAGLKLIEEDNSIMNLAAIGMPGMGDDKIINECFQVCDQKGCLMLASEKDLYDFLTTNI